LNFIGICCDFVASDFDFGGILPDFAVVCFGFAKGGCYFVMRGFGFVVGGFVFGASPLAPLLKRGEYLTLTEKRFVFKHFIGH